jgi:hypothetical protein
MIEHATTERRQLAAVPEMADNGRNHRIGGRRRRIAEAYLGVTCV